MRCGGKPITDWEWHDHYGERLPSTPINFLWYGCGRAVTFLLYFRAVPADIVRVERRDPKTKKLTVFTTEQTNQRHPGWKKEAKRRMAAVDLWCAVKEAEEA